MLNIDIGKRFIAACTHCRQGKTKCSRDQPCTRCTKKGLDCVYLKSSRPLGESKRFYDQTSDNLFMFKCESTESDEVVSKKKKESNNVFKSPSISCPSIVDGSSSSSPIQISSPSDLNEASGYIHFPLLPTIELKKPNVEYMINDFDKYLYFKASSKFDLGKDKIKSKFVIKQCQLDCHDKTRSFVGCDYLPTFELPPEVASVNCVLENHLIIVFFNNVNPYFPVIDRKNFFHKLRTEPKNIDPLLLNSICYAACPLLPFNSLYQNKCHYKLAHYFHNRALQHLKNQLENPTYVTLQALLLLYNGQCNLVDELNIKQYQIMDSLKGLFEMANLFAEDERRELLNLWWCCYLQDKICNTVRSRTLNLTSNKYQFRLPTELVLDTSNDPLILPGGNFTQLAFVGQVLIAQAFEEVHNLPSLDQVSSDKLLILITSLETKLNNQQSTINNHFDIGVANLLSVIALFIYRFYFHSIHIFLYLLAHKRFLPNQPHLAQRFLFKATQSASSAIFLCDVMNFDYFKYGPLLTLNNILMAYKAFHSIVRATSHSLDSIAMFGLDRCILTNVRNINFRIGLNVENATSQNLINEFLSLIEDF